MENFWNIFFTHQKEYKINKNYKFFYKLYKLFYKKLKNKIYIEYINTSILYFQYSNI